MRCNGTTKQGKQCRWPAETMVGGVAVCKFHVHQAAREFDTVQRAANENTDYGRLAAKCVESAKDYDAFYKSNPLNP